MKIITLGQWETTAALPILLANLGVLWAAAKSMDHTTEHIVAHLKDQLDEAFEYGLDVEYMTRGLYRIETTAVLGHMRLAGIIEGCITRTYKDNK